MRPFLSLALALGVSFLPFRSLAAPAPAAPASSAPAPTVPALGGGPGGIGAGPMVVDFGGAPPDAPVAGLNQWERGFSPAPMVDQVGTKRVIVLRVYFKDYATHTPISRYTKAQVDGFFNTNLNNLWQNISYGNINISAQVTDLFQLPDNRSSYITDHPDGDLSDGSQFGKVLTDAIANSPSSLDWSNIDAVFVVMAETDPTQFHRGQGGTCDLPMGPGGSIKHVGCAIFSENPSDSDTAVWGRWAHELGHAFQQAGPAHPSNYNNDFELMDRNYPGQSGMFEKQSSVAFPPWMPDSKYQVFTPATGGGVSNIWAEEYNPAGQPNYQACKAVLTGNLYYMISVRRRINGDELNAFMSPPGIPDEGVLIERVSVGSDPWVTVQGNGGDIRKLWHEGDTYTNQSDGIYIQVAKKIDADNYSVIVRYNSDFSHQPDVMINPWRSPPGNTWETTDIWVDSPVNGYDTYRYGKWDDGTGNLVPRGNGDDPAIGQENRLYVRVRNIGYATATNIVVHVDRTDPPGLGIAGSSGWVPVEGTGTITSAQFPALASLAPGAFTDVYIPWHANFNITPEQMAQGTFYFHTCVRVRIDPVSGETVLGNQDGIDEQENIDYFQAAPTTSPGISQNLVHLHNDDLVNPKWFYLDYTSDLPPAWKLDINGGQMALLLQPGETRDIPVVITPQGPAVIGSVFGVNVSATFFRKLVNNLNPADTHLEWKPLGGVRVESHVLQPPSITCTATWQGGRRVFVQGVLSNTAPFADPKNPFKVMIEGLTVARGFLPQTATLLTVNTDGTFSGYLFSDVQNWCPYEVICMFAGTDMLASASHIDAIAGLPKPLPGDVTGDCIVDTNDLVGLLRIAGGLETGLPGQVAAADMDGDGRLTVRDATILARQLRLKPLYSVTVSATNRYSNYGVYLDDPYLNQAPGANLVACHNWIATYNQAIGVWYDTVAQKWVIYNEDLSPMALGERFFYYTGPQVHRIARSATNPNRPDSIALNDASINNDPTAVLLATHQYVANYFTGGWGVWYEGPDWHAFNEMGTAMVNGEIAHYVDAFLFGGTNTVTAANLYPGGSGTQYGIYLDDYRLNGNPNAKVLAQHQLISNRNGSAVGVWYSAATGKWVAFNENKSALQIGEVIDYLVVP